MIERRVINNAIPYVTLRSQTRKEIFLKKQANQNFLLVMNRQVSLLNAFKGAGEPIERVIFAGRSFLFIIYYQVKKPVSLWV